MYRLAEKKQKNMRKFRHNETVETAWLVSDNNEKP